MILDRGIEPILKEQVAQVAVLEGPRMSGKTVLARKLVSDHTYEAYENLADPMIRDAARRDPAGWLASLPDTVAIDEAQLVADLPLYVKFLVDEPASRRRFLLTGSASLGRTGLGGSDPLTGRATRHRLSPFTAFELARVPHKMSNLADDLFSGHIADRHDYPPFAAAAAVTTGGFPPLALSSSRSGGPTADHWVRDTVIGLLTDDVLPDDRFDAGLAVRVLDGCLRTPGATLNLTSLGQRLSLDPRTVDRYLDVLERRFLLHFLPNLAANPARQARARSKVHSVDTAFAVESIRRAGPAAFLSPETQGRLMESWVVNQVLPCLTMANTAIGAYYWRTPKGEHEVDLVLADSTGALVGIEVKQSATVTLQDAKGLSVLAARQPVSAAYVVYSGTKTVRLGDRCWALPAAAMAS